LVGNFSFYFVMIYFGLLLTPCACALLCDWPITAKPGPATSRLFDQAWLNRSSRSTSELRGFVFLHNQLMRIGEMSGALRIGSAPPMKLLDQPHEIIIVPRFCSSYLETATSVSSLSMAVFNASKSRLDGFIIWRPSRSSAVRTNSGPTSSSKQSLNILASTTTLFICSVRSAIIYSEVALKPREAEEGDRSLMRG